MNTFFRPAADGHHRLAACGVIVLLIASATSLLIAPSLLPNSYSWLSHGTSESAAQGIEGAWLARLGFVTLGLAVLWLAASSRTVWARGAVWLHVGFGVFMVSAAAFSTRPWMPGASYDPVEDALHSFAANAMGFAFAFGVVVRWIQRDRRDMAGRLVDGIAVAAATLIPMVMSAAPTRYGVAQRLMFLIAYAWYAREAVLRLGPDMGARSRPPV